MARDIDEYRPLVNVRSLPGVSTVRQAETIAALDDDLFVPRVDTYGFNSKPTPVAAGVVGYQPQDELIVPHTGVMTATDQERQERLTNTGRKAKFTPFTLRLWERTQGGQALGGAGGLQTLQVYKGRYIIRMTAPADVWTPISEFEGRIETKALGKRIVVEKASLDREKQQLTVQINILENPIPLLILIPAAVVAIGGGIWWASEGVENTVDSVDRVLVDITETMWQWLLIALAGFAGWHFLVRPMMRKG